MTRALLSTLIALSVAVTAACGSDGDDDVRTEVVDETVPTSTTAAGLDEPPPVEVADEVSITYDGPTQIPAGAHSWTLTIANRGPDPVTLTFPTGQRGDVVLTGSDDSVVHRWSDGRFFTQARSDLVVEPAGTETVTIEDDLSGVEPGFYTAELSLAVVGPPEPVTRSVRVVATG